MTERAADPAATPPSLTDWAIEQIRRAILFGEARPGDRLVNSIWSERLGISQTPLREAFQRLAAEGFVNYDSQRGASVARLTLRDAVEIYEMRIALEPGAVAASVGAPTPAWRANLAAAFARLDDFYAGSDSVRPGFVEAHRHFHHLLRANAGSSWLLRITNMLADQSTRMQFVSLSARGGSGTARDEHRLLYEAAYAGDAGRAAELCAAHLQTTLDTLRSSERSLQ